MQTAEKFAWEQNLSRFSAQLFDEMDPGRVEVLRDLLISEENRYGAVSEQLDKADGIISQARVRLERQKVLTSGLDESDPALSAAQSLLAVMGRTLKLFEHRRELLLRQLEAAAL